MVRISLMPLSPRSWNGLLGVGVLAVLATALSWAAWTRWPAGRSGTLARPIHRVDVNHAAAAELALLPGIGPSLAQTIIAHRQSHGPFRHIEELLAVPGIGPTRLNDMIPWIVFESGAAPPAAATHPLENIR